MERNPESHKESLLELQNGFRKRQRNGMILGYFFLFFGVLILVYGFQKLDEQFTNIVNQREDNDPAAVKRNPLRGKALKDKYDSDKSGDLSREEMSLMSEADKQSYLIPDSSTATASSGIEQEKESKSGSFTDMMIYGTRLILLVFVFFIAQIFIKLYKYNINKADNFQSFFDALRMLQTLNKEETLKFDTFVKSLHTRVVDLETPNTPNFKDESQTG